MDSDNELDLVEEAERQVIADADADDYQEEVQQPDVEETDEVQEVQADSEGEENEDEAKKVVKAKRVVRNPLPKLNAETLKGPRGLTALPDLFAKQTFKGKGHEQADLNVILKTYEYWCHRLFPKLRFDQCVEKIESLGNKKPVVTYIKRIRMGLLDEPETVVGNDVQSDEERPLQQEYEREQIESVESRFDEMIGSRPEAGAGAQMQTEQMIVTEEQKEMARTNKERALKIRQDRLRKIQEQADAKLEVSMVLPSNNQATEELVNVTAIERVLGCEKTTQQVESQGLFTSSQVQGLNVIGKTTNSEEEQEIVREMLSPAPAGDESEIGVDTLLCAMDVEFQDRDERVVLQEDNQRGGDGEEIALDDLLNNLDDSST